VTLANILYATAALIVLTNPIAELPVFLRIMAEHPEMNRRRAALQVAIGVWSVLLFSSVAGPWSLDFMGIQLSAFRAAGGLLLIVMGMEMLLGRDTFLQRVEPSADDPEDALWVPLVMPMLAGPGAIVTTVSLTIREDRLFGWLPLAVVIGITVSAVLVFLILVLAGTIARHLRRRTQRLLTAFSGLLLVAIGFQMGLTGAAQFFGT